MARYRLTQPHFLGNMWLAGGAVIDWEGVPSRHMVAVDEEAKEAVAKADERRPDLPTGRETILPPAAENEEDDGGEDQPRRRRR